jgi:hypothetical protein
MKNAATFLDRHAMVKYKKPPIVQRSFGIYSAIPSEIFHARFESLRREIEKAFPDYDPLTEWRLNVQVKEGVPLFDTMRPEMVITHRFWRRNERNERVWSVRFLPDRFVMNLHRETGNVHDFGDLFKEASNWLQKWINHFEVKTYEKITLQYVNRIGADTTPQFVDSEKGSIGIGKALELFGRIPGKQVSLTPPYDCQVGLSIDPEKRCSGSYRVVGIEKGGKPAIRVDIVVWITKDEKRDLALPGVLEEMHFCHNVLIEHFEALFTAEAKKSFEPVDV